MFVRLERGETVIGSGSRGYGHYDSNLTAAEIQSMIDEYEYIGEPLIQSAEAIIKTGYVDGGGVPCEGIESKI